VLEPGVAENMLFSDVIQKAKSLPVSDTLLEMLLKGGKQDSVKTMMKFG